MAQRPEAANASPHILQYDSFPPVYSKIYLPANSYFYRGYDTGYAAVSDRPAYYTASTEIANGYGAQTARHSVGIFRTTRPLVLYDIRYISVILREYIRQRKVPETPAERARDSDIQAGIYTASLALGLCSFSAQIGLIRQRYAKEIALGNPLVTEPLLAMESYARVPPQGGNPIELEGVRIADGENDSTLVAFLAELFTGPEAADGYIAPSMKSPYHTEKGGILNSELLVFNPRLSGIVQVPFASAEDIAALKNVREYPIRVLLETIGNYHIGCYGYAKIYIPAQRGGNETRSRRKRPTDLERMLCHASVIFDAGGPRYAAIRAKSAAIAAAWKQALPWPTSKLHIRHPIIRCSPWLISEPTAPDTQDKTNKKE
jgi:hypothetical protein